MYLSISVNMAAIMGRPPKWACTVRLIISGASER